MEQRRGVDSGVDFRVRVPTLKFWDSPVPLGFDALGVGGRTRSVLENHQALENIC